MRASPLTLDHLCAWRDAELVFLEEAPEIAFPVNLCSSFPAPREPLDTTPTDSKVLTAPTVSPLHIFPSEGGESDFVARTADDRASAAPGGAPPSRLPQKYINSILYRKLV